MSNTHSTTARADILAGIRNANSVKASVGNRDADYRSVPRQYQRSGARSPTEVLNLFEERIVEYDARVFHVDAAAIGPTIRRVLSERKKTAVIVPAGLPVEWDLNPSEFRVDDGFGHDVLDGFDGVVTAASSAIAVTGTIVLQHGPGQGRRAITLIPDYHLCVVRADQVVETVSQSLSNLDPARPTTFISGPSATADIEMTRIKGVHGPRFLDVILVAEQLPVD